MLFTRSVRAHRSPLAGVALSAAALPIASQPLDAPAFVPGQIIVTPVGAPPEVGSLVLGMRVLETTLTGSALLVEAPPGAERAAISVLAALERVAAAEPNHLGRGGAIDLDPPSDTHFHEQWHHRNTGQTNGATHGTPGADIETLAAWAYAQGHASTVVAVLDTGSDFAHPDLAGRLLSDGADFVNEDDDPQADHPHGPRVIGCLVARVDNAFGVAGVDRHARVLPVKVLDQNNRGTTFDLIQGLEFAAARSDVHIISLSLINYPGTDALRAALDDADAAGKVIVSCGSNNGAIADASWPGASPATIAIGSTTHTDARAAFSGRGASIDFVAPGQGIVTIEPFTSLDERDLPSGCSFATPIVAGVAGLIRAEALALGVPFTRQLVVDTLAAGAEDGAGHPDEDTPGRDDFMGRGRINARASLFALRARFGCLADTNADGAATPADFYAFLLALGAGDLPRCDQNGDGACTPADLDAWILNYNAGC